MFARPTGRDANHGFPVEFSVFAARLNSFMHKRLMFRTLMQKFPTADTKYPKLRGKLTYGTNRHVCGEYEALIMCNSLRIPAHWNSVVSRLTQYMSRLWAVPNMHTKEDLHT